MRLNPNIPGSRKHDGLKHLEGVSGLYVIWKAKQVYVGSTRNLRSRLRSHSKRFAGWEVTIQELDITAARYKEAIYIRKLVARGDIVVLNTYLLPSAGRHPSVSRACYFNRLRIGWAEDRARKTPVRKR